MRAVWESWKPLPELSPYCWCLNVTHASALDTTCAIIQNCVPHQRPPKTSVLTRLKNSAHVSWPSLAWVQTLWAFFPIWIEKLPVGGFPHIVPKIHCKIMSHKIHMHWSPFSFKTRGRQTAVPMTWVYFINEFICCNIYLKGKKIEETRQKNKKI